MASELESDLQDTLDCGRKWYVGFNAGKSQEVSFDQCDNTGAIDGKTNGSVLKENSSFSMLESTFASKLDWSCYIISIAKTTSKKVGALICSMMFLSPEVALYLYVSMHGILLSCLAWCS